MTTRRSALAVAVLIGCALGTSTVAEASEPDILNGVGSTASNVPASAPDSTSVRSFITFDTGTSPCLFQQTAPLRDEYASLGVSFSGASSSTGGAIINECGNFGVGARSGQEFLAFNGSTYATTPEHLRFSGLQRSVEMYVANGSAAGESTYTLTGRRRGHVVARTSITTTVVGYVLIRVAHFRGMGRVTLSAKVPDDTFVVDDLRFRALA